MHNATMDTHVLLRLRISLIIASVCILTPDVLAFVLTRSSSKFDATFNCVSATTTRHPARVCDARFISYAKRTADDLIDSSLFITSGEKSSDSNIPTNSNQAVTGVTLKLAFDSSPNCWGIADLSATKSERFTSPRSLDMVHRLRAVSDCVLVGRGTVVADDCTLTVRRGYETSILEKLGRNQPTRVVLDSNLELIRHHMDQNCEATYKMFEDGLPVIIYHLGTVDIGEDLKAFLKDRPAITLSDTSKLPSISIDDDATSIIQGGSLQTFSIQEKPATSFISPQLVVQDLHSRGIHHIMVEGGAATALSFLRAGVVDRAIIVKASVQFQEPLDSKINENILEHDGGLKMLGTSDDKGDMFGGDSLMYWVRDGRKEMWPADNLTEWP